MKSLEIVKDDLVTQEFLKSDYIYECERNYEEPREETLARYEKRIKELETIKQDLEVLEIINKKDVDIGYIKDLVKRFDDNEYILERYNNIVSALYKLTLEELLKLKQWLEREEKEND